MAGAFSPITRFILTDNGVPVAGAKLYTWLSRTSTPSPVYTTAALDVEHTNPVIADASGMFPAIYTGARAYRTLVTDADGATVIPTQDGVYDFGQLYGLQQSEDGDVTITRDLAVTRNLTVGGTAAVTGAATVGGTLGVTDVATFADDVYNVAWTDYSATSTVTGWAGGVSTKIFYKKLGRLVFVAFQIQGTSNSTAATFTVPFARPANAYDLSFAMAGFIQDNSADVTTNAYGTIASGASTVVLGRFAGSTTWTGSGTKRVSGQFWYEAAS